MPQLQQITETVLHQVEEASGIPVILTPDASLQLLASMTMARRSAPAHVISYNPNTATADYAICCQCGFILRVWATPKEQRFDIATTERGRADTERLVSDQFKQMPLSKEQKHQLSDRFYNGLLTQLRSVPIGLRVDAWLSQDYPALADQQKVTIHRQLQEHAATLGPEIRSLTPAKVFAANAAMNTAVAAYWSRQWSDPTLLSPYRISGHLAEGDELLRFFDATPSSPEHDRDLIDGWGHRLGLEGWYKLVPLEQN